MVKKSFNPFKMWGAWVGAGVGFLIFVIPIILSFILKSHPSQWSLFRTIFEYAFYINPVYYIELAYCHEAGCGLITLITMPIIGLIIGFFIGYGIHTLIRGLRK